MSKKRFNIIRIGVLFLIGIFFFTFLPANQVVSAVPTPTPTPTLGMEFGKVETVYDWSEQQCDVWDRPDIVAKALIDADGNVQLYAVSSVSNRKSIGDNLSDVTHDCRRIFANHDNPDLRLYDDNNWLMSPYTLDGTTIYGLVHMEYHGWEPADQVAAGLRACNVPTAIAPHPPACWWNAINLAKSIDKGDSFVYATLPDQNVANTSVDYDPDYPYNTGVFSSSNIMAKDGYYYVTTNTIVPTEITPIYKACLMRTNNLDDPSSWRYWDGSSQDVTTSFSIPARGVPASGSGTCAMINIMKSDLHWSDYLNKYTNIGRNSDGRWFLKTAPTITNWNGSMVISSVPLDNLYSNPTKYHALIQPGAETRNFEDIGRSPWMYYVVDNGNFDRDLNRIRVRFNKPGDAGRYDVLDLRFNEYKGKKALDSSFYVNDGTLSDGAEFVQEGDTKFVRFPGSGNVTVPYDSSLDLSGDITIDMRLRTTQQPSGDIPIVSKESLGKRNYGIWLTGDGKIRFSTSDGLATVESESDKAINDGAWHKVTVTFSSTSGVASYWIDGVLDKEVTQGGNLSGGLNSAPVNIGSYSFIGDLDNVTIYNYVPTSIPALTPTPTPSPTPISTSSLTFTLSFEGVSSNVGGKNVRVSFYQGNQLVKSKDFIAGYQGGVYQGTLSNPPEGTFDIEIKTDRHVSRRRLGVTIADGANAIDFPDLLAGDIEAGLGQLSDNTINILDFNKLLSGLTSPRTTTPVADLNYDEVVNAVDYSIMSGNFTEEGE